MARIESKERIRLAEINRARGPALAERAELSSRQDAPLVVLKRYAKCLRYVPTKQPDASGSKLLWFTQNSRDFCSVQCSR